MTTPLVAVTIPQPLRARFIGGVLHIWAACEGCPDCGSTGCAWYLGALYELPAEAKPAPPEFETKHFRIRKDHVPGIRELAVSQGWFEIPSGDYERLRMKHSGRGTLVVYHSDAKGRTTVVVSAPGYVASQLVDAWKALS